MTDHRLRKVAAAHAAPVFLDKAATAEKAVALIAEAAGRGADLVVFPESFIPGFPIWAALWAPIVNHDLFAAFAAQSLLLDGPEIARIRAAARKHEVFVSLGFSERNEVSVGGMWNSNLLIGDRGEVLNLHRKLVPTFFEKMVWASGDGAGLKVVETRLGRLGALICGENTNPLARFSLMAQGEQVHISTWPPIWPTRRPKERGNYNNIAANRIRASAHSFEAKAFGIVCAGFLDKATRDFLVARDADAAEVLDNTPQAETFFVDPTGEVIGERAQAEETLAYAEIDLAACVEPKQFHDVVGYYNRFDVFDLTVRRQRLRPARFLDIPEAADAKALEPAFADEEEA